MSQILSNNTDYSQTSQNELSCMLGQFESSYIYSILDDNFNERFDNRFVTYVANLVQACENNFKNMESWYPMDHDNILFVRDRTYEEIIEEICKKYNFSISDNISNLQDKFTLAYYLYDFLISNFSTNITLFFSRYICKEKNNIYKSLNLDEAKKNKDSSTVYYKKIIESDTKIALINAHLDEVLKFICGFDITVEDILYTVYNRGIANLILENITPTDSFFKDNYCRAIFDRELSPLFNTYIRLSIQKFYND